MLVVVVYISPHFLIGKKVYLMDLGSEKVTESNNYKSNQILSHQSKESIMGTIENFKLSPPLDKIYRI